MSAAGSRQHESTDTNYPTTPLHHFGKRLRVKGEGIMRVVRADSSTYLWPVAVLALVLGVGVWGVNRVSQIEANGARDRAASLALDTAIWYRQQLTVSISPVVLMAAIVQYNPQYSAVSSLFKVLAPTLLSQTAPNITKQLEYVPYGVVQDIYPMTGNNGGAKGFDLFASSDAAGAIETIKDNALTLVGPLAFFEGGYGVIVRQPIFISGVDADETFGIPVQLNPFCGGPCGYNATTGTKFWGFAAALVDLDALNAAEDSKLRTLEALGYNYEVRALGIASADMRQVAASARSPSEPVEALVHLPNNEWVVRVSPAAGWRTHTYRGLLSGVIVMAIALAALLFVALVSRRQHEMLLKALLPKQVIKDLGKDPALLGTRILQAETTADLMLATLDRLLEGAMPDPRDVLFIRQALIRGVDLYQPMNLNQHIVEANLDKDVARALMQQLGHNATALSLISTVADEPRPTGSFTMRGVPAHYQHQDYSTLSGGLSVVLSTRQTTNRRETVPGNPGDTECETTSPAARVTDMGSLNGHRSSTLGTAVPVRVAAASHRDGSVCGFGAPGSSSRNVSMEFSQLQPGPRSPTASGRRSGLGSQEFPVASHVSCSGHGQEPAEAALAAAAEEGPEPNTDRDAPPRQASGVQDDSTLRSLEPPKRRLPRRVASALGATGLVTSLRRRSLLQTAADQAVSNPSVHAPAEGAVETGPAHGQNESMSGLAQVGSRMRQALTGGSRHSPAVPYSSTRPSAIGRVQCLPPPPPVIEEVERVLAHADSWQFDMWRLRDATNGHPLSALGFYLIHRAGLMQHLKLKPPVLARLLRHIEAGYNDNPYHNATHAADVLQTLHVIIHGGQLHVHYLDRIGLLAAYFSAIIHDYGHPGLTNDFLIATSDPLAVRYNDRSPLENHHAAAAFSLMQHSGLDLLAPLNKADRAAFRKQVIEMVLGTDMKQHFALLSQFNTVHRLAGFVHGSTSEFPGKSAPSMRTSGTQCQLELKEVVVAVSGMEAQAPKPVDETERLLSLQIAIKAADLGHLGEDLDVHKRWLATLEEEFFRQGDQERLLGLPISPLFDRSKQGVSKSQVGFMDFVALPLVFALTKAFPGAQPLMRCFWRNYNHWRSVDGMAHVEVPAMASNTTATSGQVSVSITTEATGK